MTKPHNKRAGQSAQLRRRASIFQNRRLIAVILLLLAVASYYGLKAWSRSAESAAHRQQVFADVATEFAKAEPNMDMLSVLVARLTRLPDASTAPDILAARAEIALLRGRPERADDLFGAIAASPNATPIQRRLGSRILLQKQQGFGGDVVASQAMLEQVIEMSDAAYADGGDVEDLFRAWLAATRLWDARKDEIAERLKADHPSSPECKLAELNAGFKPERDGVKVAQLAVEFRRQPPELRAMQVLVILFEDQDVPGALKAAEQVLNIAPGVPGVRLVMAMVLHVCVMGKLSESADPSVFVKRRDAQLNWLDKHAPVAERAKWDEMR